MEKYNKLIISSIVLIIILLVLGGYYLLNNKSSNSNNNNSNTNENIDDKELEFDSKYVGKYNPVEWISKTPGYIQINNDGTFE